MRLPFIFPTILRRKLIGEKKNLWLNNNIGLYFTLIMP